MIESFEAAAGYAQSVRSARRHALESNYDVAAVLYEGLAQDAEAYVSCCDDDAACADWELLREKMTEECSLVRSIQNELQALVSPGDAVRLDRPTAMCAKGPLSSSPPPPVRKQTLDDLGTRNEILYGDRDRFGPSDGPVPRHTNVGAASKAANHVLLPVSRTRSHTQGSVSTTVIPSFRKVKPKVDTRRVEKGSKSARRRQGPPATIPRFTARSGEEELVSLIELDMHFGPTAVAWEDIAGLAEAKSLLEEAVVYPVLMPDYYQGIRRPWKGVLLYGPPGTGKTMLAKAVASECNTTFFNVSPASLTSKWRGDTEKLIRALFEMARHYAPSTIFIDEIDALCSQRGDSGEHEASRRAKGTLLAQMDGVGVDPGKTVMVLGATNHPWCIDEAMRRRLEKRIYIPLPDFDDRVALFRINTKSLKLSPDVNFSTLSEMLEGRHYSCADITNLVRDAAMMTMRRVVGEMDKAELKRRAAEIGKRVADQPTTMSDFLSAVKNVPSSVNAEQIKKFEAWQKEFETNP